MECSNPIAPQVLPLVMRFASCAGRERRVCREGGAGPRSRPAALSGCAVGIPATGTIVLDGGAAQGRRALTLVRDHHICVVRAGQIVNNIPQAFEALHPARPLTFISGPSATSDIELDRVPGTGFWQRCRKKVATGIREMASRR